VVSDVTEETGFSESPGRGSKVASKNDGPGWFLVKASHPRENGRVVFRSVSETRARQFVENRYPRGSEVYLETPGGETQSFEFERAGDKGQDAPRWDTFNPADYVPPEQAPPPGDSEWADREG
jgi:hypothetical protein